MAQYQAAEISDNVELTRIAGHLLEGLSSIESPEKACAFLDLHEIESPRPSSSQKHIQTWSDAPNIALAWGRVEAPTDIEEGTTAKANVSKRMSRGPNYPDKSDDFHDILPSDEVYFVDVVPPD